MAKRALSPVLVALAAFCASLEGGGVMLPGERIAAWAKAGGAWVNPYATEGLKYMWDAFYRPDADASTWTDVVSGVVATGDGENPVLTFSDSGAVLSGKTRMLATLPEWDTTDPFTVEVACKLDGNGLTGAFRLASQNQLENGTSYYYAQASVRYAGYHIIATGNTQQWLWNSATRHYCLAYAGSNPLRVYRNGVLNASPNLASGNYWGRLVTLGAGMGCYAGTGTLCSVRIYIRALTADEIAARYAIDLDRFPVLTT